MVMEQAVRAAERIYAPIGRQDARRRAGQAGRSPWLSSSTWRRRAASRRFRDDPDLKLSRGLGWFSIGLGLVQAVAPGWVARAIGLKDDDDSRTWMRIVGIRELAVGTGILERPSTPGLLWGRVLGDKLDLGLLGAALLTGKARQPGRTLFATALVAGATAADLTGAVRLTRRSGSFLGRGARASGLHVHDAISVNRPPEEVYRFWHDFRNLPRFMSHLESVEVTGDRRSRWTAKAPAGMTVEWDAEIVQDRPNELIAWRSLEGATVPNSGEVRFVRGPGGKGTEVHVAITYDPPAGALGSIVARLFGEQPEQQVHDDLRLFKQVMETGEIMRSDASIHARPHPARPPERQDGR